MSLQWLLTSRTFHVVHFFLDQIHVARDLLEQDTSLSGELELFRFCKKTKVVEIYKDPLVAQTKEVLYFIVWRRSVVAAVLIALKPRGGAYSPCSSTPATHLTLNSMGADTRAAKNRSLWGCVKTKNSTFPARVSVLIKYRNWYIFTYSIRQKPPSVEVCQN